VVIKKLLTFSSSCCAPPGSRNRDFQGWSLEISSCSDPHSWEEMYLWEAFRYFSDSCLTGKPRFVSSCRTSVIYTTVMHSAGLRFAILFECPDLCPYTLKSQLKQGYPSLHLGKMESIVFLFPEMLIRDWSGKTPGG